MRDFYSISDTYIQGHHCLFLGPVREIFQLTVRALKQENLSMTHFSTNAAAYCMIQSPKRADCTLFFPSFLLLLRKTDEMKNKAMYCRDKTKSAFEKKLITQALLFFPFLM